MRSKWEEKAGPLGNWENPGNMLKCLYELQTLTISSLCQDVH